MSFRIQSTSKPVAELNSFAKQSQHQSNLSADDFMFLDMQGVAQSSTASAAQSKPKKGGNAIRVCSLAQSDFY